MPTWQRILGAWIDFLFGCPRRTLVLIGIGFGLYLVCNPVVLAAVINYFVREIVNPLLPLLLVLAIAWLGFRALWRSAFPAKKKGGK